MTSTTSVMEVTGDGRGINVELIKVKLMLMAQAAKRVNERSTKERLSEKAPAAALLNKPILPPTGGGILQHPTRVAFATMLGTAEAAKSLVQSVWRNTRSLDSSSRVTLAYKHKRVQQNAHVQLDHTRKDLHVLCECAVAESDTCSDAVLRTGNKCNGVAQIGQDAVAGLHAAARRIKLRSNRDGTTHLVMPSTPVAHSDPHISWVVPLPVHAAQPSAAAHDEWFDKQE